MPVTLINVFEVPTAQEDEFLRRWQETAAVFARTDGFLETHLHRNMGFGNQTFRFVNFALWASVEAFTQAHREYSPGEEKIAGVTFHPALFEEIIMTRNLLSTTPQSASSS